MQMLEAPEEVGLDIYTCKKLIGHNVKINNDGVEWSKY